MGTIIPIQFGGNKFLAKYQELHRNIKRNVALLCNIKKRKMFYKYLENYAETH